MSVKDSMSTDQLWEIYVKEIVRLHGVPKTIISDYDTRFVLAFLRRLQRSKGTKLALNIVYHPQINGHTEWMN